MLKNLKIELQGVFSLARSKLDELKNHNNHLSKGWLDKIRVVQPTQSLLPPQINLDIQSDIYRAVLENRQILTIYKPVGIEESKEYVLHPLGIIMRGSVIYLVASAWDYSAVRLYALHRFNQITLLDKAVQVPDGFNIDKAIAEGFADFVTQDGAIQLEILCDQCVADYLAETPLSNDQIVKLEADGWLRLTATVNDTWQLRWWLLSQGAGLEVCLPLSLRAEIKAALIEASKLYT